MAENFKVTGIKSLEQIFEDIPKNIETRVSKKGITKAAARMRLRTRQAAPKLTGKLRKAIVVRKSKRFPIAWVGLGKIKGETRVRYYYNRLENDYLGTHAFFAKAVDRASPEVLELLRSETLAALYEEAGKQYAKSIRSKK